MEWITLKNELEDLKANWETNPNNPKTFGDAGFLQVKVSTHLGWRFAKEVCGGKKHYDGWVFFSASTNDNIYEMYMEVCKLIDKHGCQDIMHTTERQL
tara:strand:- start:201 stop:494 length:294 start_codon:yes stop_codon:yes gene_type:complete